MPPNLRFVAAQGWRSFGSRRSFSSSTGSKESKGGDGALRGLYDRGFALLGGYSLGGIMIKNPASELASALDDDERDLEALILKRQAQGKSD